ncbi:MAG: hypothetical protein NT123_12525 [Proteobacteria bacterium]|nr:hypothetical protein [Pseudomonadota bacterium]
MSPEGEAAAARSIELSLVDAKREFAQKYGQTTSEYNSRGVFRSSMFVLAIAQLCEAQYMTRAKLAWSIAQRIIDSEGWTPSEANRAQIRQLIDEAVSRQSPDLAGQYETAKNFLPNANYPDLEPMRMHAIESAMADAEIDLLGRQAKRPPLIDELSAPRYSSSRSHWLKAIAFSEDAPPDLPNAVKEVASCLESLAKIILGKDGVTLGQAVKDLRSLQRLPAGADKILEGLWTFSNQSPGARHGSSNAAHIDPSHWSFVRTVAEGGMRLLLDIDAG